MSSVQGINAVGGKVVIHGSFLGLPSVPSRVLPFLLRADRRRRCMQMHVAFDEFLHAYLAGKAFANPAPEFDTFIV